MLRQVLFQGDEIELVGRGLPTLQDNAAPICITFSPLSPTKKTALYGFGEKFLVDLGIPALHFISRSNHWWQVHDMTQCLDIARQVLTIYKLRFGYGSSMGAYGVLNFSRQLELTALLAFAPQYSPSPSKIAWEKRWFEDRRELVCIDDSMDVRPDCDCYVVFDPKSPDGTHARLISQHHSLLTCELPGKGHFVLKDVMERNLLTPMFHAAYKNDRTEFNRIATILALAQSN